MLKTCQNLNVILSRLTAKFKIEPIKTMQILLVSDLKPIADNSEKTPAV